MTDTMVGGDTGRIRRGKGTQGKIRVPATESYLGNWASAFV